jgi:HEAT repeat protein
MFIDNADLTDSFDLLPLKSLLEGLKSNDEQIRLRVVKALGFLRNEDAVTTLCTTLKTDKSAEVRWAAAEALDLIYDLI